MMFGDIITIDSVSSTKTQGTVGEKWISYTLETRGASDYILLQNVTY